MGLHSNYKAWGLDLYIASILWRNQGWPLQRRFTVHSHTAHALLVSVDHKSCVFDLRTEFHLQFCFICLKYKPSMLSGKGCNFLDMCFELPIVQGL